MNTLLFKCALGMLLLVSIAAAPFSGSDLARTADEAITSSSTVAATMLDHGKSRWARERQVHLVESVAEVAVPALPAVENLPPGETAGGMTVCPVLLTVCPLQTTACPGIPTECPKRATICEKTVCPTVWTKCPLLFTRCPIVITTCWFTVCPFVETICNEETECYFHTICPEPCIWESGPPTWVEPGSEDGHLSRMDQVGTVAPAVTFLPAIGD